MYHVEILDLLTITNYLHQNLTANFIASPSCTRNCHLECSPPTCKNATTVDTFKSLFLKWKRLNGHLNISITTANLSLYFVLV